MSRIRKLVTAGATFGVALGIGFVMQNGDVLAARFGDVPGQPAEVMPAAVAAVQARAASAGLRPQARPMLQPAAAVIAAPPANCGVALSAQGMPVGLVNLTLQAPCAPLSAVTLHHGGMIFSGMTDAAGALLVTVPALATSAVFIAEVGTTSAVTAIDIPGLDRLDRVVLQTQNGAGLQLQALEFGAVPGDAGHVWSGSPRDPVQALEGAGGFFLELGDPAVPMARLAQVYTLPRDRVTQDGDITLSLTAAITAETCGQTIAAQTIQITPGGPAVARDLAVTLPGCDRAGTTVTVDGLLTPLQLTAQPG